MGLRQTVDKGLLIAWKKIGNLKRDVIFNSIPQGDFDFGTGQPVATTPVSVTVQGVILEVKKTSSDSNVEQKEILLKYKDVGNVTLNDTITIETLVWRIGKVVYSDSDSFIVYLQLFREA